MRQSPVLLHFTSAILIGTLTVSCNQTARMDFSDKMFVKQEVTKLGNGGIRVVMQGNELRNPTAALERFHEIASKQFGSSPYTYTYQLDQADVTAVHYRTEKTQREVPVGQTSSYSYIPIYGAGSGRGGGGMGGGEAAIVLASALVLTLLIKAAANSSQSKSASASSRATTKPQTMTVTDSKVVKENRVVGQAMRLSGTAQPVAKLNWPKAQPIEVVIPTAAPIIGKMSPENATRFAEAAAESLRSLGYTANVVKSPSAGGNRVTPVVLRVQGVMDAGQQQMTVEYELSTPSTRQRPARVLVQTTNPFGGASLGGRDSLDFGYRPAGLVKPLAKRLAIAL